MNKVENLIVKIEDEAVRVGAKALIKAENAVGKLMTKRVGKLLVTVPLIISMLTMTVAADADGNAQATIDQIIELLKQWIPRLGGLLVVVGGIQLGIGFKDDDATGKTRGMQCMIGGAIVAAIGAAVSL
ncbi:MAG: hypothetical protein J1F60_02085 [Oscillospiraceae bacterium]|nr:hypothetical protein [Oscillospiraceae bacterium]